MATRPFTPVGTVNIGSAYTQEETEFIRAIEAYQRQQGRKCLAWTEVLAIAEGLGYRKVAPATLDIRGRR